MEKTKKIKEVIEEVIGIGLMAAFPIVMFIIYADAVGHPIF